VSGTHKTPVAAQQLGSLAFASSQVLDGALFLDGSRVLAFPDSSGPLLLLLLLFWASFIACQ
jgi:hypothetical protein